MACFARPIGRFQIITPLRLGKSQKCGIVEDDIEHPTYGLKKLGESQILTPIRPCELPIEAIRRIALKLEREGMNPEGPTALEPWMLQNICRSLTYRVEGDYLDENVVVKIRGDPMVLHHVPVTEPVKIPRSTEYESAKTGLMPMENVRSYRAQIHIPVTEPVDISRAEKW